LNLIILKKIITGLFLLGFLSGCAQNSALLGPAYTLVTTGNIYNAGITYGGNDIITRTTGKSTVQNLKEALTPKEEDTAFEMLVKKNIKKTRKKLKLSNQ
tara:strand:+ start:311 stop:610 length:300 start_codon:yes stop_codon:yes gene_type:complete